MCWLGVLPHLACACTGPSFCFPCTAHSGHAMLDDLVSDVRRFGACEMSLESQQGVAEASHAKVPSATEQKESATEAVAPLQKAGEDTAFNDLEEALIRKLMEFIEESADPEAAVRTLRGTHAGLPTSLAEEAIRRVEDATISEGRFQ